MTVVKICGIMDVQNGLVAIDAGAEYLGFVFYPLSHRALDPLAAAQLVAALRAARPAGWQAVAVFVNEPLELVDQIRRLCAFDVIQLNGEETHDYVRGVGAPVFKAARYEMGAALPSASEYGAQRMLLDANVPGEYGGTGVTYDWTTVREAVAHGFLAGGLTPANVAQAITAAQPWGVDVSSGVERDRVKDPRLIEQFLDAVRAADGRLRADLSVEIGSPHALAHDHEPAAPRRQDIASPGAVR